MNGYTPEYAGDIVPTSSNEKYFEIGDMKSIVSKELTDLLWAADVRIFNLEVPLTDKELPIEKWGPNLIASKASVNGLKALKVNFVTLANNHIMDQSREGLDSTTAALDSEGIFHAGTGKDLAEACQPFVLKCDDGTMVGIYCCAEHEFSIAGDDMPGANPFDPLESLDHISLLKTHCDYVICLYHGGKEHYRYPSPNLQRTCRKIVEKGADLVVCQHSHCIGCEEKWKNGTIVYGQGNFLFDHSDSEFWQTGMLVSVELGSGSKVGYIPIVKAGNGVRLASETEGEAIMAAFSKRSDQIVDKYFVDNEYKKFAKGSIPNYLISTEMLLGSFLFRALNKICKGWLYRKLSSRKLRRHRVQLINYTECEAHRELYITGLKSAVK